MDQTVIAKISFMCPNLKSFGISGDSIQALQNFCEVGRGIWTHLTKLETLDIKIDMDSPANYFPAVDSCFTGFSSDDCIRLYDLIEANNILKKCGARTQVPQTELDLERQTPSIFDLKGTNNEYNI